MWKFVKTQVARRRQRSHRRHLIDDDKKPEFLTAKLVSQQPGLRGPGAAGRRAAGQDRQRQSTQQRQTQQQLEATGDLFPNVPLQVEKLRAMNMDVTLDAKRVVAPDYLPVQALSFRVVVNNGVATVKPLTLALVGGGRDRRRAGYRCAHRHAQGPRQPAGRATSSSKTFFRNSKLLRCHPGQGAGPRERWPAPATRSPR